MSHSCGKSLKRVILLLLANVFSSLLVMSHHDLCFSCIQVRRLWSVVRLLSQLVSSNVIFLSTSNLRVCARAFIFDVSLFVTVSFTGFLLSVLVYFCWHFCFLFIFIKSTHRLNFSCSLVCSAVQTLIHHSELYHFGNQKCTPTHTYFRILPVHNCIYCAHLSPLLFTRVLSSNLLVP